MRSNVYSAAALALASSGLVSAQTSSACDPVKGDKCNPDQACPPSTTIDFTQGASSFFDVAAGTTLTYDPSTGAAFTIKSGTDAPTISSNCYIFFGQVDVWTKAAPGAGIISSFVLESDDLDEVDWEWVGSETTRAQTNYFSKGDTTTYDRGGYAAVANAAATMHKYSLIWTNATLQWLIDDAVVRTLNYGDAKGGTTYPQTPMQIKLGTWVGGLPGKPQGVIDWAGGLADFSQGPFVANYQKVNVINYSNGQSNAGQYTYGDTSGTFGSIKIDGSSSSSSGSGSGSGSSSGSSSAASSSPAPSSTAAPSSSAASSSGDAKTTLAPVTTSSTSFTSTATSSSSSSGTASSTAAPKSAAGKISMSSLHVTLVAAVLALGAYIL